jgi:hypothetical protein
MCRKASCAAAPAAWTPAAAPPNDREIERWTDNVYVTASYDRQFASDWGINVAVPLVIRPHATIAEDTDSESRSRTHGLGISASPRAGRGCPRPVASPLQFGLVLPTGGFHQTFRSGRHRAKWSIAACNPAPARPRR